MPTVISATEYLSFDAVVSPALPAVPLDTPAWTVVDYSPLYGVPDRVGTDRVIPGVNGRLAVRRELDEWRVSLPLHVFGERDHTDAANSDLHLGIRNNLDYLRTNLVLPLDPRAVTFHRYDGSTKTGTVIVDDWAENIIINAAGALGAAVLTLVIPAGVLT